MFWIRDVLISLGEMDVSIALLGKGAVAAFTTTGVLDVAAAAAVLPVFAAVAAHIVPASFDAVAIIVVAAAAV
jgi:hypothetical protein